jgi:sucrose phosphorylase
LESLENHTQGMTGVMLNAYPDSIGKRLSDVLELLQLEDFKDVFSLFYVLPTFFNSDLDRGFSVIDYNINKALVSEKDLQTIKDLAIDVKFDIVLNHLSVASPQFKDLLKYGESSKYKDFFINWNTFWKNHGTLNEEGIVIPDEVHLKKLFMRKAGLPILKLKFPDGSEQPYWNTFYQKVGYESVVPDDFTDVDLSEAIVDRLCQQINEATQSGSEIDFTAFDFSETTTQQITKIVDSKKFYLGQMDVNAKSLMVWDFYKETLAKLKSYGCKILRLDAFAYLHKAVGESNFFNTPGTWNYLDRIHVMAQEYNIQLLPEIHAEYGSGLHKEVAEKGYMIYDFFLPGLLIHAIEFQTNTALIKWAQEILDNDYQTVNMLGCHDGIPVLDLKGKTVDGQYHEGLLKDHEIERVMEIVMERGGKVKNLYGPNGEKISYYQVNATFFSALGEDEQKLLLARAIQLFMPGIPQVWYLDLFAGKNDYEAVERAGAGGHKEINRTNLSTEYIQENLQRPIVQKQLELLRLRNTSKAFSGSLTIHPSEAHQLDFSWENGSEVTHLKADLRTYHFSIVSDSSEEGIKKKYNF